MRVAHTACGIIWFGLLVASTGCCVDLGHCQPQTAAAVRDRAVLEARGIDFNGKRLVVKQPPKGEAKNDDCPTTQVKLSGSPTLCVAYDVASGYEPTGQVAAVSVNGQIVGYVEYTGKGGTKTLEVPLKGHLHKSQNEIVVVAVLVDGPGLPPTKAGLRIRDGVDSRCGALSDGEDISVGFFCQRFEVEYTE